MSWKTSTEPPEEHHRAPAEPPAVCSLQFANWCSEHRTALHPASPWPTYARILFVDFSSPFNTNTRLPPPEAYPAHCAHLSGSLTVEMTVDFRTPQTNTCTTFKHFATFPLCVFLLYAFLLFCMYFSCCIHSSFLLLILAVVLFILLHHAQLLWSTYNFSVYAQWQ